MRILPFPLRVCAVMLLAGHLAGAAAEAQVGRRLFSTLGPDQGLPSGAIITMTQDADGFLWLGTENGLVRYDGGQARHWTTADGLPSGWIARIRPARGGGLWVGTLRGLVRFKDGRFERARFGDKPSDVSSGLFEEDGRGRLWVATSDGIYLQQDGLQFRRHEAVVGGRVPLIAAGPRTGAIYLASERGIHVFQADGTVLLWGPADGLPPDGPTLVVEDGEGRVWAGAGRTLVVKQPGSARFVDQSARLPASLSPNSSPFLEGDGSVWLPTQGGALRLHGDVSEVIAAASGLPFRWVRSVMRDREGTLWILGPALARLQGSGRVWNYSLSADASGEVVWFVTRDPAGRLLVATDDGAARMEPSGLVRIAGTEGRRIKYLTVDHTGLMWLVNTMGPTLWLRPGAAAAETAPLGELGSAVNSVFEDRQRRIWLGHTRHGVLRWDPQARRLVQEVAPAFVPAAALGAYGIREDAQGRLWVGSSAGLLVRGTDGAWQRFTQKDGLQPNSVRGFDFLADGSAWVHYQEPGGLTRVRVDGARLSVLEHRTTASGLRSNLIYAVDVDDRQQVWVTTDQGLGRLDPPLHIGRHDGMVSEDCAVHALLAEGSRVWAGTAAGLVRFDNADERRPQAPPRAHVLAVDYGTTRLEPPFATIGPIPSAQATVSFRVAAPSYVNERALRFQARLVGLEDEWRPIGERSVRYPAMRGGDYRFEVRAALADGPFGPPSVVAFAVQPPWWGTWWASLLLGFAGAGAMVGLVKWRVGALARSKAALEVQVAQRTAELRARNAELSAALGTVKQLTGLLPICAHCKKIRDDKGYWNQLEQYLREHANLGFSHGICPDCAKEMYPDLDLS